MIEYLVFAGTMAIFLIFALIYLYPGSKRVTTVPGPDISDPLEGNFPDITASGSFHEFLTELHETYGDIVSFWWGPKMCVSIASPALFKEHSKVFDRPPELFKLFEPLIGADSLQYANGADGRNRHAKYANCFTYEAIEGYYPVFHKLSKDLCVKFNKMPKDDHIPLGQFMSAFAIKAIFDAALNKLFKNDADVLKFKKNYDIVWWDMENTLKGDKPDVNSDRYDRFEKSKAELHNIMKAVTEEAKKTHKSPGDPKKLLETLLDLGYSNEKTGCDMLTVTIGGFHTSSLLLTWGLYFLASHQDDQEKLYEELIDVLGDEDVTRDVSSDLVFMRQVIDETLRCADIATMAARVSKTDIELGGHIIPAETPVVHALGVIHHSEKWWAEPNKFDPNRFSPENRKNIPLHAFEPFGFSGKRKCLGYQFSVHEAIVLFSYIIRRYKVSLVPGQVVTPEYGLVTKPKEEIWVTLEKREEREK